MLWEFVAEIHIMRPGSCQLTCQGQGLWLPRLIEEDEVGDDDPCHGEDERPGDVEEAKPSEHRLGTLKDSWLS